MRISPAHGPRLGGALRVMRRETKVVAVVPRLNGSGFRFRWSCSNAIVVFPKTGAKAAVPASNAERHMRCRLTLAVAAALVGGSSIAAHAQAPVDQSPTVVNRSAGIAGTGIGSGAGPAGQHVPLIVGTGHLGAGTGGTGMGVGNVLAVSRAAPALGPAVFGITRRWEVSTGGVNGADAVSVSEPVA